MPNTCPTSSTSQLALNFQQKAGRPTVAKDRRRKAKSVTLAPDLIAHFDEWTYKKRLSFSRGVENAILAFMQRSDNDADV